MPKVWITLSKDHFVGGKVRRAGTSIEVDEKLAGVFGKLPKKEAPAKAIEPPAETVETETAADEPIEQPTTKARKARKS